MCYLLDKERRSRPEVSRKWLVSKGKGGLHIVFYIVIVFESTHTHTFTNIYIYSRVKKKWNLPKNDEKKNYCLLNSVQWRQLVCARSLVFYFYFGVIIFYFWQSQSSTQWRQCEWPERRPWDNRLSPLRKSARPRCVYHVINGAHQKIATRGFLSFHLLAATRFIKVDL